VTGDEAEHWLFEAGEWVPSSYVVPFLGPDAAEQIARWAGTDDGQRPILRTRARMVEYRRTDGSIAKRQRNRLFGFFWQSDAVSSNCVAGNFDRTSESLLLVATGVELSKDDLDRLIGTEPPVATIAPAPVVGSKFEADVPTDPLRGVLPPNATHSHRRDEEAAHEAAKLVRSGRVWHPPGFWLDVRSKHRTPNRPLKLIQIDQATSRPVRFSWVPQQRGALKCRTMTTRF
jgi:hypothetical protein